MDMLYFGVGGGTGFDEILGGNDEIVLSGVVAYALTEGLWFEWEPAKATDDSTTTSVSYTKAGYKLLSGESFEVYAGGQLVSRDDVDKDAYGGWLGVMFPVTEGIKARLTMDYLEEGASAIKVTFFVVGGEW
jgi:hypothetical protein